jgi:hypothetical protein
MIYTSYFAKARTFPENVFPVAICAGVPSWYNGARYSKLAPPYELLMQWKCDHNNDNYEECFNEVVLNKLDVQRTIVDLQLLLPDEVRAKMQSPVSANQDYHIALLCYEKPSDFCHRHLVAEWFNRNAVKCKEIEHG